MPGGKDDDRPEDRKPPAKKSPPKQSPPPPPPPAREIVCPPGASSRSSNNNNNHDASAATSLASTATMTTTPTNVVAAATPLPALTSSTPFTGSTALGMTPNWDPPTRKGGPEEQEMIVSDNQQDDVRAMQARWFRQEVVLLSGTSVLALVTALYLLLPATVLMALSLWLASSMALVLTLFRYASDRFRHDGMAAYLPASVVQMLTETTLHEWMTDPTFALEYRHLLLYFLPGLSAEQLERYLQQLAPHHWAVLQRRGLGHFLGDSAMRIILGQDLYDAHAVAAAEPAAGNNVVDALTSYGELVSAPPSTLPPEPRRRLLYADDDASSQSSDLGLDITGQDLAGGVTEQQAVTMAMYLGLDRERPAVVTSPPPAPVTSSNNNNAWNTPAPAATSPRDDPDRAVIQGAYDQEEQVLTDAFWSSYASTIVSPLTQYVRDTVTNDVVWPTTHALQRASFGLSVISGGLAMVISFWNSPSGHRGSTSGGLASTSPRSLLTVTIFSGASAGLLGALRWYFLSRTSTTGDNDRSSDSTPSKPGSGIAKEKQP